MRTVIALTCLALLVGFNKAMAQATHSLSVSRHVSVSFSESQVDDILAAASKMLQKAGSPGACDVTLKRIGPIQTFTSPNPKGIIRNTTDRDAVHRVNFDSSVINVKIVNEIKSCLPGNTDFVGCGWPKSFRSIIMVAHQHFSELVWPHEFGHQTGLFHRPVDKATALMSPCPLGADNVQVNQDECTCFQKGLGGCPHLKEVHPGCPQH